MWHKQSFTQFWSQSDAYSRRSSLKLTYIHHPLVVCTHQICCAVAVPIALSQDRRLHGHNRLVNWTPCSRMRESKLIMIKNISFQLQRQANVHINLTPIPSSGRHFLNIVGWQVDHKVGIMTTLSFQCVWLKFHWGVLRTKAIKFSTLVKQYNKKNFNNIWTDIT